MHPKVKKHWRVLLLGTLVLIAAIAGTWLGRSMRLGLPNVNALEDYAPPVTTRVLDQHGSVVETFAEQRRMLVQHDAIAPQFLEALVAVEDAGFYDHPGVDVKGILRAAVRNVAAGGITQGASTLTQQLARNLFLTPKRTIRRKAQEALLALEIERLYSKEEILRFYCNQVYMGHGYYGVEAASRFYTGKPARELDLPEAAMLAGLIQRPEGISPFKNPKRAESRRRHVLNRMVEVGYLTREAADSAAKAPLPSPEARREGEGGAYYVEGVRRWLQDQFGDTSIYRAGYEVETTLDPRLQAIANQAVESGLRALDKRQGWRGPAGKVPEGEDPATFEPDSWGSALFEEGDILDGVVQSADRSAAVVRVGPYTASLDAKAMAWTKEKNPGRLLSAGDLVHVAIAAVDTDAGSISITLEQEPEVEAALVALDPSTGAVRALVGGFDFERSEYDRATQARRQTGSAFKPFVLAAALNEGWTLADTLVDAPTVFLNPRQPDPYIPRNYTNRYYGKMTLREAMERSANVATVKLLNHIGTGPVIETARRLGIGGNLEPYPSLALGAFELTLLELTSAYGTMANQGVRVEPHLVREVRDPSGAVLYRVEPAVSEAMSPEVAYLMNQVLRGVITSGTGRSAASIPVALAGKTGTTDDNTDAWFIGYSPDLALGVWVGHDTKRTLGKRETGAQAALPIWREFMKQAYPDGSELEFPQPPGIRRVVIDRKTGKRANPAAGCDAGFTEVFLDGSEPAGYCTAAEQRQASWPYMFHRYELDDRGALRIPARHVHQLMTSADELSLDGYPGQRRFRWWDEERGNMTIPFSIIPGGEPEPLPEFIRRYLAQNGESPGDWFGTDGRFADVTLFRSGGASREAR